MKLARFHILTLATRFTIDPLLPDNTMVDSRIGIWLIGAKGGVASTAILGLAALKRGLV